MDKLFATIATDLQFAPALVDRVHRATLMVETNNERIARAGLVLGNMEDYPGAFDPWCRSYARSAD